MAIWRKYSRITVSNEQAIRRSQIWRYGCPYFETFNLRRQQTPENQIKSERVVEALVDFARQQKEGAKFAKKNYKRMKLKLRTS